MKIQSFTFNPFQENTYVVYDDTKQCIIIDPGCYSPQEKQYLLEFLEDNNLKPVRLLNTHCHLDHVFGNDFIKEKFGLKLEAHKNEIPMLELAPISASKYGCPMETPSGIDLFLDENDVITFGNSKLSILFTPGHSPGSISFYSQKHQFVIAGDVLFRLSIGRTDLPMGNHEQLLNSVREQLFTLDKKTSVYSGHGPETSIGYEIANNPFF
ncbi:MAG: MBL fold metallo-hydrolase [Chitinophagales bacterium]